MSALPHAIPRPHGIRVVVDDSAVYRHGIVRALHRDPRFEVVGFFEDGDARAVAEIEHDVLLVDDLLDTTTGLDLVSDLRHAGEPATAVLISASLTEAIGDRARRLGVAATLDKMLSRAAIRDALAAAAAPAALQPA